MGARYSSPQLAARCSAEQLAEAVTLWSIATFGNPVLPSYPREREAIDDLKPLDLFLSTMEVFRDGFEGKFKDAYNQHKDQFLISKQTFIDFLQPRCLLLTQNNGCFELVLVCAFVFTVILIRSSDDRCFHFSRVSYKLLTKVLEDKFSDILNTDSGWEDLMSFCRKTLSAVFPSRENRPSSNSLTDEKSEVNKDFSNEEKNADGKETTSSGELLETFLRKMQEGLEYTNEEPNPIVCINYASLKVMNSVNVAESSDAEDIDDDSVYWNYETMSNWSICKRITENSKHLEDVFHLLNLMKQELDQEHVSSNKYDIPISDDEDIDKLERRISKPDKSRWKIKFEDGTSVDYLTYKIAQWKNEKSDKLPEDEMKFQDVTDEDKLQYLAEMNEIPEEEPRCKLCHGRMYEFEKNWLESVGDKYEFVSDYL